LWVTDGTSHGTHMVKDIYPGERGIYPEQNMPMGFIPFGLTRVGARLFFNAEAPGQGYGLWVSDGTEAGTQFVSRLGTTDSSPEYWELTALDDATLLFIARTGRLTYGLYRSDGTEAGTQLVYDVSYDRDPGGLRLYPPAGGLHAVSDRVYFLNGATLWQTDGTPEGTAQSGQHGADMVVEFGGKPYFLAYDQSTGVDLMQTPDGPVIATVAPTLAQANGSPEPAAGQLFIAVNSPGGRAELWVSDGTTAGTRPTLALKGLLLRQSDGYSGEHTVTSLGGRLIFLADDSIHGGEPWVSDGTPTGTLMLKDINQ
ncbi:MAG: hypothetical protein HGA19_06515, partial [Oscillochloris sp.]|nr:hypothetical protein [Oscillochloris sp.]